MSISTGGADKKILSHVVKAPAASIFPVALYLRVLCAQQLLNRANGPVKKAYRSTVSMYSQGTDKLFFASRWTQLASPRTVFEGYSAGKPGLSNPRTARSPDINAGQGTEQKNCGLNPEKKESSQFFFREKAFSSCYYLLVRQRL